ncbi:MAG: peptidylprolyl isomerase [Zhengella sp.]|uniref:peptidylprolyl isomerase n=1 Tax=Zhengella sp. TaxID=2282762 RepID=UPI001D7C1461|nr:peptidylprolyl isomerase [Notoacmeibacter sp.]MCC0028593.1 peptidylprolyl isomerase [Brucellaceae bacterium]
MPVSFSRLAAGLSAAILAAGILAAPALAANDTVVATVNGMEITEGDLSLAIANLDQQFARLPEEQRRGAALSALIEIRLLAAKAREKGYDKDAEFQNRMAFLANRALHSEYVEKEVAEAVTDEMVRARYDKELADTPPSNEVHARHILVKTKEEAEAIIKELDGGADFAELAKAKSTGPSGPNGGDLGYFQQGQMVPEFEKAAFGLDVGAYTKEPVQTQFGWHVIQVEDKRAVQPPAFDAVKDQVRSAMLRETYFEMVSKMREDAEVNVVDETLKGVVEQMDKAK